MVIPILAVCFALAGAAHAGVLKFDMGTKGSPVWDGFVQVTPTTVYERQKGYGWKRPPAKSGTSTRFKSFPDALVCDWVGPAATARLNQQQRRTYSRFSGEMEFAIDLPAGTYRVWAIMEYYEAPPWYSYRTASSTHFSVVAEGRKALSVSIDEETWVGEYYYRHLDDDYRRGDHPFDKYIMPRFRPHVFLVEVKDGQLNLLFRNNVLNALVVWPVGEEKKAQEFLRRLTEERRRAFPLKLMLPVYDRPAPKPSPKESSRGYILFFPHYSVDVFPNYVPLARERRSMMRLFAAEGEYEPGVLAVYPLRDLRACRIEVTDLRSDDGNTIARDRVDVRVVRYMEWPVALGGYYTVNPEVLMRRDRIDIDKGICKSFWLTFHAPTGTKGGIYRGKVRFVPEDAPAAEVAIELRVLPFDLGYPEGRYQGVWWVNPRFPGGSLADYARDLKEHGLNVIHFGCPTRASMRNGQIELDFSRWQEIIDVYRNAGYPSKRIVVQGAAARPAFRLTKEPLRYKGYKGSLAHIAKKSFSPGFDRAFLEVARRTKAEGEKRGWPEIYFYEAGEGGSEGKWGIFAETHMLELLKRAGVKGTASINTYPAFVADLPLVSVCQIRPGLIDDNVYRRIRDAGKPLWFYGASTRAHRGLYFWLTRAELAAREATVHCAGEPYDEFDSVSATWPRARRTHWPSPDGVLNTPDWEREREGIDDARYLYRLEQMIKDTAKNTNPLVVKARTRAQKFLDELRRRYPIDYGYYESYAGWPSDEELDCIRWQVAREILSIQEALRK